MECKCCGSCKIKKRCNRTTVTNWVKKAKEKLDEKLKKN